MVEVTPYIDAILKLVRSFPESGAQDLQSIISVLDAIHTLVFGLVIIGCFLLALFIVFLVYYLSDKDGI